MEGHRFFAAPAFFVALIVAMLASDRSAYADDSKARSCDGPAECCPEKLVHQAVPSSAQVDVGVVLIGINEINEKNSTWTADFYLYEQWPQAPGFMPQVEIVNEVNRISEQFDTTERKADRCVRTRRIRSTLHTEYNLRTFPFDHQALTLQLSDAQFNSREVHYAESVTIAGLDEGIARQLSGWKVISDLQYARTQRAFKWDEGAPDYDYATFAVSVRRHVSFHLSKYFLPLLLIVIVSFSVFWIDPDDLASEVQIGVTCLLAAIALQFAEGGTLPDVNYLTIADRTYSICYVAIGIAVLQSVFTNRLARSGKREKALTVDKWSRRVFPVALVVALAAAVFRSYTQSS